jgi:hypothetical protein
MTTATHAKTTAQQGLLRASLLACAKDIPVILV